MQEDGSNIFREFPKIATRNRSEWVPVKERTSSHKNGRRRSREVLSSLMGSIVTLRPNVPKSKEIRMVNNAEK